MNRGADGSIVAAPVWNEFMRAVLDGTPVESFLAPNIPTTGKPVLDGEIPSQTIVIDTASGKLATDRTPARFREEKICGEYHTILAYVDRNNPTGDVPTDPKKDPAYEAWETGVQNYLAREKEKADAEGTPALEACDIPTEEDDIHVAHNTPSVNIRDPKRNDNVDRQFTVRVNAEAPRGVSRLEYLIDDTVITVDQNTSGTILRLPSWVKRGDHTLRVRVYDDVDNTASDDVQVHVNADGGSSDFSITNPFNNQTIERALEPYAIGIEAAGAADYQHFSLQFKNLWNGSNGSIFETSNPTSFMNIPWTLPEAAEYLLNANAVTRGGETLDASPIKVLVKDPPPVSTTLPATP